MAQKASKRRPAAMQDRLVAEALRDAGKPVGAYDIIHQLRDTATLAPQTVYRALSRLIADGRAHRLESINAFVACHQPHHAGVAVFAICEDCHSVTEFEDAESTARLAAWADKNHFTVRESTLELRGRCAVCAGG